VGRFLLASFSVGFLSCASVWGFWISCWVNIAGFVFVWSVDKVYRNGSGVGVFGPLLPASPRPARGGIPLHLLPMRSPTHQQLRLYCSQPPEPPAPKLTHLTSTGEAHMVPIHTKAVTTRTAIAEGSVLFSSATALSLISSNANKKGDVLAVSRISGIMAAKKCAELVVLCHPIPLSSVEVDVTPIMETPEEAQDEGEVVVREPGERNRVQIRARVTCEGKTGVEMEALTAVMGAALAVVDMCKAVDKGMEISGVRVVSKTGGRSGDWGEAVEGERKGVEGKEVDS
jgi:molybdenum cofactor biosynthesis protein MoaC